MESFHLGAPGNFSLPMKVLWHQDQWLVGVGFKPSFIDRHTGLALSLRMLWKRAAAIWDRGQGHLPETLEGGIKLDTASVQGWGPRPIRSAPGATALPLCASLPTPAARLPATATATAAVAAAAATAVVVAAKTEGEKRARKHFSFFFLSLFF